MIADLLGVFGAVLLGYTVPELAVLLGSGQHPAPSLLNVAVGLAFGLLAIAVLF